MATTIVGIPGSLRARSYNRALLRAAVALAPEGTSLVEESIAGVPLYDADREASEGVPARVEELKARVSSSDGLLLVTPEYNHGIPGPFKNAIDWMSRPPRDMARVFGGRPAGVIGASTGRGATLRAQIAWLPVLQELRMVPFFGASLAIARAASVFDDELRLVDEALRERLRAYLAAFAAFCARVRAARTQT